MSARTAYNLALRAAVARILANRREMPLASIERELPGEIAPPSRPTLAKAVVAAGWSKVQRPGSGAIYRAPMAPVCRCAECQGLDREHPADGRQLALAGLEGTR